MLNATSEYRCHNIIIYSMDIFKFKKKMKHELLNVFEDELNDPSCH